MTVGGRPEGGGAGNGLALQTEDATFKQTIDQRTVTEMPLNGRQMTALITLSGGSTAAPAATLPAASTLTKPSLSRSPAAWATRPCGGWTAATITTTWPTATFRSPSPMRSASSASNRTASARRMDMHTGGMVNVVTRSGTNKYHGSFFEFIRNNYIDATNFFSSCTPWHRTTVGKGHVAPESIRRAPSAARSSGTNSLPSPHTSALQAEQSRPQRRPKCRLRQTWRAICPSQTGRPAPQMASSSLVDPLTGAKAGRQQISDPANLQSAGAGTWRNTYLQSIRPVDDRNCGLVSYAIPSKQSDNQFVTRVDWTINAKNNLYGRYFIDGYQAPAFYSPTNILITTQSGNLQRVQTFTLGEAFTISRQDRKHCPPHDHAAPQQPRIRRRRHQRRYSRRQSLPGRAQRPATGNEQQIHHRRRHKLGLPFQRQHPCLRRRRNDDSRQAPVRLRWSSGSRTSSISPTPTSPTAHSPSRGVYSAQWSERRYGDWRPRTRLPQGALNSLPAEQVAAERPTRTDPEPIHSGYLPRHSATDDDRRPPLVLRNSCPWMSSTAESSSIWPIFWRTQVSSVYPNAPAGALYYGDPGVPGSSHRTRPGSSLRTSVCRTIPSAMAKPSCAAASRWVMTR